MNNTTNNNSTSNNNNNNKKEDDRKNKGYLHNPYNGVICNDIILATGVFSSKELWKLSKGMDHICMYTITNIFCVFKIQKKKTVCVFIHLNIWYPKLFFFSFFTALWI